MLDNRIIIFKNTTQKYIQYLAIALIILPSVNYLCNYEVPFWFWIVLFLSIIGIINYDSTTAHFIYIDNGNLIHEYELFIKFKKNISLDEIKAIVLHRSNARLDRNHILIHFYSKKKEYIYFIGNDSDYKKVSEVFSNSWFNVEYE
ncbi:MAG: hypothetical protein IPM86_10550 [Saprospiraceae bacterium]|nr:hypothetical protein [Saprospiraceae bacterium]